MTDDEAFRADLVSLRRRNLCGRSKLEEMCGGTVGVGRNHGLYIVVAYVHASTEF